MYCENRFCIYWAAERCSLKKVSLDYGGRCFESILVGIPEDILQVEREKALAAHQAVYRRWEELDREEAEVGRKL